MVEWNQAYEISDSKNPLKWRNYKTSIIFGLVPAVTGRNWWLSGREITSVQLYARSLLLKSPLVSDTRLQLAGPLQGPPSLAYHWHGFCIHNVSSYIFCVFPDCCFLHKFEDCLKKMQVWLIWSMRRFQWMGRCSYSSKQIGYWEYEVSRLVIGFITY